MNQPIEHILDQALAELAAGKPIADVVKQYPQHAAELQSLLAIAATGLNMRQNTIPTPVRKRAFAEKGKTLFALHIFGFMRWSAVPLSLLLIFLGARTVLHAANDSMPNSRFYTIKRAQEKIEVSLTRDSNKQAALQLELSQRRLDELKQATASQDPAQEAAALVELNDQTEKTFAIVPQVAASKAIAQNDSSLLDSLAAITKEQKQVVSAITDKPETNELATTALNTVEQNRKNIASIIATVQEQGLADLKYKISVTGEAAFTNDKTKITVESTAFVITKDTTITSPDGEAIAVTAIVPKSKVTVVGTKENNVVTAKVITLVESRAITDPKGDVKGTMTTVKPSPAATTDDKTGNTTKKPSPTPPQIVEPTPEAQSEQANKVTSGFIVEPPAGQSAP